MLRAMEQAVKSRGLLHPGEHVLVAVSGGADSVALLYGLHYLRRKWGFPLTVAHLNHRIRGTEAREDAEFVSQLAWRLGAPCYVGEVDVPRQAVEKGISLEMAAREARYDFLSRVAQEVGARCVATAHTADDQVETVLLKLARGTAGAGLAGIPWESEWNGVRIVRPLRGISRKEVEAFLRAHGLRWREDRTNWNTKILRNCIRHEVLPLMERKLNARLREAILRMSEILAEENKLLETHAQHVWQRCRASESGALRVNALLRHPPAIRRRVLRIWLARSGVNPDAVDYALLEAVHRLVLDERGTKQIALPQGRLAVRRYDVLTLELQRPKVTRPFKTVLHCPGEVVIPQAGLRVVALIGKGILQQTGARIGVWPAETSIGLDAVQQSPLIVRSWCPGDRMRPLGLKGSKKLQDIFVDAKVPRDRRGSIPVFECRGEIVWIPGYRVAEGWEVKDAAGPALHLYVDVW